MGLGLSVVIPIYNEEGNIANLFSKLENALASINREYEIIFVDDGSIDDTFPILMEIRNRFNRMKIIKLRKNFGKSVALNVAFKHITGDFIITLDGDLQDDPDEIQNFLKKLDEGYDLVNGWKYERKDPLTKRLSSKVFNKLSSILIGVKIHDFNCGFKGYRREFLNNVCLYGEMHRYIPAIAQWHGFTVTEIKVKHSPRRSGRSKYGFSRIPKGFLDLITVKFLIGYSVRPLHIFGTLGIASLFTGLAAGLYFIILKHVGSISLAESVFLLVSVIFIFIGFQSLSIGLLGEMIAAHRAAEENVDVYIKKIL